MNIIQTFVQLQQAFVAEGQRFTCVERASAEYTVQASGYVVLAGDVTFANGLVGALQIIGAGNAKQFGAIGDDIADDTASLISWLSRGSSHYLPAGIYRTSGTVTKNGQFWKIQGDGMQLSIIKSYGNYDTLVLDNGAALISRVSLSNIGVFANAGNKTAGASIKANTKLVGSEFTNIYVRHFYDAFLLSGCAKFYMTNIFYDQFGRDVSTAGRYGINGADVVNSLDDFHLVNIQGSGFGTGSDYKMLAHMYFRKFDGVYMTNSHFFWADLILDIDPADSEVCASLLVSNTYFDTTRVAHFRVNTSTGSTLKSYGFEGCTFRASGQGSSIQLLNTDLIDGLRFIGGTIRSNFGSGIQQSTAGDNLTGLIVSGVTFQDNNLNNDSLGGDVVVRADASVINSNTFSGGGALGSCVRFFSSGDNNIATINNMNASTCATKIADGGAGNTTSGNIL
jgi:hypothetical protein